jgi:hypothetical protein
MLWPVLLALALTAGLRAGPAQVDCANVVSEGVAAYVVYLADPLDAISAEARLFEAQGLQAEADPALLADATWLVTIQATAANLRAAALALQQAPMVPPALQGVDTLFRSAGGHLVEAMDYFTEDLLNDENTQFLRGLDRAERALAELTAAVPALEGVVDCFVP